MVKKVTVKFKIQRVLTKNTLGPESSFYSNFLKKLYKLNLFLNHDYD